MMLCGVNETSGYIHVCSVGYLMSLRWKRMTNACKLQTKNSEWEAGDDITFTYNNMLINCQKIRNFGENYEQLSIAA